MTTAPMPPVGPLTSTKHLLPGDILRVVDICRGGPAVGSLVLVVKANHEDVCVNPSDDGDAWLANRFAFVARPGAWMPWAGGENPVPGMNVRTRLRNSLEIGYGPSSEYDWKHGNIVEYMVLHKRGDPVDPPFGCTLIQFDPFTGKDGDQVRVSFTAIIDSETNGPRFFGALSTRFPDLKIELIGRPLKVGDRVVTPEDTPKEGTILHIAYEHAMVKFDGPYPDLWALDRLRPA